MEKNEDIVNDFFNEGSAKVLDGNTYVLIIFAGHWRDSSYQDFLNKVFEAEKWLTTQAARYGKTIGFQNGSYGKSQLIDVGEHIPGTGSGNEDVKVVGKALSAVGYVDNAQFCRWVKEETNCNNCLVIVAFDLPGRGYSMAYNPGYSKMYYLEGFVMYTQYEDGDENCAAGIAHEILHCFGADDLYETFLQSKSVDEFAARYYPNDIMHRVDYDINKLEIGEFTAWSVGLTDKKKDFYKYLITK